MKKIYYSDIGRSPVTAKNGMVATSHPLATDAALEVLKSGGNALDAAICAASVQNVVEPQSTGIGGDCFAIFAPNGGTDYAAYNGSGRTPKAATAKYYADQGITEISQNSPHAVTIPGAVDAWCRLSEDYGSMPLKEVLAPAIKFAREGYKIYPRVAADFASAKEALNSCENAKRIFMPGGSILSAGDIHKQPELADNLEIIGNEGRNEFYQGTVADDIVSYLKDRGGLHTLDDFKEAKGDFVTPVSVNYQGFDVYECPPNGQGVIALILLKIMDRLGVNKFDLLSPEHLHYEAEAGKIAYHIRDLYLSDPDYGSGKLEEILSDKNIDHLIDTIKGDRVLTMSDYQMPDHRDTVYISVVDKDRNCCSFINSIFHSFGSGLMSPKTGVLLHSRGKGFNFIKGHPNQMDAFKRPLHTIIPAMLAKNDKTVMSFGVMGGQYQAYGHMQFLSRLLDYNYDIQQAMDLPRSFPDPVSGKLDLEISVGDECRFKLKELGHDINVVSKPIGGSQAIWIDRENGTLIAGSDPRKDGYAAGY